MEDKIITPDRYDYKFKCGIIAYQEECDYQQWLESIKLLKEGLPPAGDDKSSIIDMLILTFGSSSVMKLVRLLLTVTECPDPLKDTEGNIDWTKLKGGEVVKVINDFFVLNPESIMMFGIGKSGVDFPQA